MGLKSTLGPAKGAGLGVRGRGEACVEALIFLELGISIIYLAYEHIILAFKSYWVALLVIELICAVVVSVVCPPNSPGPFAPFLAPLLSLLFQATVLPILALALRVHLAKQSQNNAQISPLQEIRTPSFAGTSHSSASDSLPSTASHHVQKISSPKSSTSELTAVNHFQLSGLRSPHVDANALESGVASSDTGEETLGRRIASSRSTCLLVILIASQSAAFVAFVLEIAAAKVGLSAALLSSDSSTAADARAHAYATLQIFRVALMVLCITGIMSAFLLHAYNAYPRAAPTGRQVETDHPILPPAVDLSRMNAITVSISTTAAPPLSATKVRTVNSPVVFSATVTDGICAPKNAFGRNDPTKEVLTRHSSSASYSSSFACPMAKNLPPHSMLLCSETLADKPAPRLAPRDSKFDDDDGEPGYAYIYADGQSSEGLQERSSLTDPLNVGEPTPFRARQCFSPRSRVPSCPAPASPSPPPLHRSRSDSIFTNRGIEGSLAPIINPSPPLPSPSHAPIDIPPPKFANPYPTPRSTPTATAFADHASSSSDDPSPLPDSMVRPQLSRASTTSSKMAKSVTTYSSSEDHYSSERPIVDASRTSYCSSSGTHIPARTSSPTPTPTRAPTPGLMFTPFLGSHVRKRDSGGLRVRASPPSPPSPFLKFKEKAKKITSKHDSIGETLAHSFEGIRNGLGGSNGKTKYPLKSSTSNSSLGLGLGMTSGFKFPHLTRRPSELGKEQRNMSSMTLAETNEEATVSREPDPVSLSQREPPGKQRLEVQEEGDFMDLRDPFACPNALTGGSVRIMSSTELSIRTGRESRTGHRDEDIFEFEGAQTSRSASNGKSSKGMRMSAWGRLPASPQPGPSSPAVSPHIPRYAQHGQPTPAPSPARSRTRKGRSRGSKSGKAGSSRSLDGSPPNGRVDGSGGEPFEDGFVYEEALIAQQLLRKLDERLWATTEES